MKQELDVCVCLRTLDVNEIRPFPSQLSRESQVAEHRAQASSELSFKAVAKWQMSRQKIILQ